MNGMEKKQETKKSKSLVKKAKKIRSMIMMTLLCVLMMSAATYAWFTLSNTAKATNLTMTVGDTTGLQIAKDKGDGPDTFGSSIEFDTIKGKILPATTTDGKAFLKPEYDEDGAVSSTVNTDVHLDKTNTDDKKEGYYIQYTFYLKSLGKDSTVKLAPGSGFSDGIYTETNKAGYTGTYVLYNKPTADTSTTKGLASAAVRLSFSKDNLSAVVFEPNSDIDNTGFSFVEKTDYAADKTTSKNSAITSTIKQSSTGTFTDNAAVVDLKANENTKITLNVWIEGTDAQCVNQISAKNLIGQLVFTNKEEPAIP